MFKRLFWLCVGLSIGLGTSFWVMRLVRRTVERYLPERVASEAAVRARGFAEDVKAAVAEGRQAMKERESALWAELGTRT